MIEIPGYTVLRLLGHGGMATVYLAQQQSLRREVALKILSSSLAQDATATERFLREARISAKLHHPHIVAIYDVGLHDGVPYMSIAYEPGGTVAQKTQLHGDTKFALHIIRDIAGALDYAHRQGVIHRDVKPENILLRNDGTPVLSDFGIAHAVEAQTGLTREGTSVGTPHYMSPEQLRGEHVDGRTDLYSLGVVFYQLLTGQLPYQGTDGWAIGIQHISSQIPHLPSNLNHLQPFLDAMLAKDPAQRPQTGAEVVQWADLRLASLTPAMTVAMAMPISGSSQTSARSNAASIAILPFADMSQGKDQEYLADGLSEELLNLLSKIPGLVVAGRSSAASFKGKNARLVDIGKELKVATVLEGSIRKFGERVRISVQLINVADGFQMWSETYDRTLIDVFAIQDEIAALVAAELKVQLLPKPAVAPAVDPELARQLQLGRERLQGGSRDDAQAAIAAFGKVLAIDAKHSEAQAGNEAALQLLSRLDAAEAKLKAAREAAEQAAAREREATEKAAAEAKAREREAAEKAEAEAREREAAERAAAEAREHEAAERAAAEARKRELAARAAAEALEREAAEKSAAAARERADAEKAASEAQERLAAAKATMEARQRGTVANSAEETTNRDSAAAAERDAAARAAEARDREAAEKSAAAAKEREAAAQAEADARNREAAEKTAAEAQQREAAEKAAAESRQQEDALQALAEARRRDAEKSAATLVPGMRPAGTAEPARDPALEFASAYRSQAKSKSGSAPEPKSAAPSKQPEPSGAGKSKKVPAIIGAIVVVLGLVAWIFISRVATQHREQCQTLLTQAQSAIGGNDFDKATAAAADAAGVCSGDQQTQLQTLNTTIQTGREQAKVCDSTEAQAKDLLGKGLPAQASALLFQAHADCGERVSFSQLVRQPAEAQTDARNLIIRATGLVQANALDDAQKLIDQALALDNDVPDAQKLLIKMAAKRGKLPSQP
ncbi:MAG TPA: serine/threonine-protein kinase [Luteimonas sp.]|nr:serine/threonine-protein kinase [Luteimonas sp.]